MTNDRILSLHQEASEHYLNGRFDEAVAAWNAVLRLDPVNEEALEGVRMAKLLAGGAPEEGTPSTGGVEADIDAGLRVFEFDAVPAGPPEGTPEDAETTGDLPDAERVSQGIDFGDLSIVDPVPLAPPSEEVDLLPDPEEKGLAAVPPARFGEDPAVHELKHRIASLLIEARAKASAGDHAAALSIVARIQLLEEDNEDACALETELRGAGARNADEIDGWIIEGVSALESGRTDDARGWFVKVLERSPDHREAQHYLAEVAKRAHGPAASTSAEETGIFLSNSDAPPVGEGTLVDPLPIARPAPRHPREGDSPLGSASPSMPRAYEAPRAPGSRRGLWAAIFVLGLLAVAAGGWVVLSGDESAEPPPPLRADAGPAPSPEPSRRAAPTPATSAPSLEASLGRARRAMTARDFSAAVVAYDEALRADPTSVEARDGMARAVAAYKEGKAEREQLDRVRMAFEDGEYASALRLVYRLPENTDPAAVERWKGNGWFNLGIVALRAGEAPQAIQHFDEALSIRPDAGAKRWREFAERYRSVPKDRAYYDAVEAIPFRALDD